MRRPAIHLLLALLLLGTHTVHAQDTPSLKPLAFQPLPLGAIRPEGWILEQLRIQADGLSGHLDEFWPDVKESGWIGGETEGWERAPYWLDGLVPMAYLLDDDALKAKVVRWVEYILAHQHEDGWLGPVHGERDSKVSKNKYDPWPIFIMLKALSQYEEATGDPRVWPAVRRVLERLNQVVDETPLFEWGQFRWADGVLTVHHYYDHHPEAWLLDLAAKLHAQGYDWQKHFTDFTLERRVLITGASLATHGVNNAMGVKAPAIWYRQSGEAATLQGTFDGVRNLDRFHGQATGMFSCDEHLAGLHPSQGSELCAVVEYMYSLEHAIAVSGDAALADRLESLAFNALPATFTADMWAHQYDQQANQAIVCVSKRPVFATNGGEANLFGLEPNYGCCLANMHQGWPKFVSHLWMATPTGGLAAVAYAPCTVQTAAGGAPVKIVVTTDYPFGERISIKIETSATQHFPIALRIPAWAEGATALVSGKAVAGVPGTFLVLEEDWRAGGRIELRFPMKARMGKRFNGAVSIHRGPLVFALEIAQEWRQLRGELPHADWEVFPQTPWNYGLALEGGEGAIDFEVGPVAGNVFAAEYTPVRASVAGRRIAEWQLKNDAADAPPQSPVDSTEPLENLRLLPYGAAKLRITEFPVLAP
ncbi:MAG: glycoside hydrolase family 127 protein [Candidatus Hydrogenedentes bacterium]|nr:glycoside hydrolase family 127 protein [Candidatus Hydrogenedentota bacterium]